MSVIIFYNFNFQIFPKFTLLKKFITITSLLFGITFTTVAQSKTGAPDVSEATKTIKFFPNPATSDINFEFTQAYDKTFSLQIYNFMGKKVYEFTPNGQRKNISLDGMFRGVYIFQLRDKSGKIIDSGRFQVVK